MAGTTQQKMGDVNSGNLSDLAAQCSTTLARRKLPTLAKRVRTASSASKNTRASGANLHPRGDRGMAAPDRHETGLMVKAEHLLLRRAAETLLVRSVGEEKDQSVNQIHKQVETIGSDLKQEKIAKAHELIVQCSHAGDRDDKKTYTSEITEEEVRSLAIDTKSHNSCRRPMKSRVLQKLNARLRQRMSSQRRNVREQAKESAVKVNQLHSSESGSKPERHPKAMSTAVGAGSSASAEEEEDLSQPKARDIRGGGARWHFSPNSVVSAHHRGGVCDVHLVCNPIQMLCRSLFTCVHTIFFFSSRDADCSQPLKGRKRT